MLQTDINDLLRLNRRILGQTKAGFRTHEVFCIARTGQKIRFSQAEHVESQLVLIMEKFNSLYQTANTRESLAQALSYFWLGFIAIHPFSNGNGRTGKSFVEAKVAAKGFALVDFHELDGLLLIGKTQEDLMNLVQFFYQHLKPGVTHATSNR